MKKVLYFLVLAMTVVTFIACSNDDDDKKSVSVPTMTELESNSASYIQYVRKGVEAYLYFYNSKLYYMVSAGVPTPPFIYDCQISNGKLHLSRTLNNGNKEQMTFETVIKTKGSAKTLVLQYEQGTSPDTQILYDGDYEYSQESLRHVFFLH